MKKTWIEWLHELPVDYVLRDFLTGHGLAMPADFAWTDTPVTTQALIEALLGCPDPSVRDPIAAKLRAGVALGDPAGAQAIGDGPRWGNTSMPSRPLDPGRMWAHSLVTTRCAGSSSDRPTGRPHAKSWLR